MFLHVALSAEGLAAAERTRKRLQVEVNAHVDVQVGALAERLATPLVLALVRLGAQVQVDVRNQLRARLERFPALLMGADEELFFAILLVSLLERPCKLLSWRIVYPRVYAILLPFLVGREEPLLGKRCWHDCFGDLLGCFAEFL